MNHREGNIICHIPKGYTITHEVLNVLAQQWSNNGGVTLSEKQSQHILEEYGCAPSLTLNIGSGEDLDDLNDLQLPGVELDPDNTEE